MKLTSLIITFAVINISGCTVDTVQEKNVSTSNFDLYGPRNEITLYSKIKPEGIHAKKLQNFKNGNGSGYGYYGAFAYSPSAGEKLVSTSARSYNTLKSAIDDALYGCSSFVKKGDEPCKIIAVMTPKGYESKQKLTLNSHNTQALKKMGNKEQFKAFATSDRGSAFYYTGKRTQEIANRSALDACNLKEKTTTNRRLKIRPCYLIPEAQ